MDGRLLVRMGISRMAMASRKRVGVGDELVGFVSIWDGKGAGI